MVSESPIEYRNRPVVFSTEATYDALFVSLYFIKMVDWLPAGIALRLIHAQKEWVFVRRRIVVGFVTTIASSPPSRDKAMLDCPMKYGDNNIFTPPV